MKREIKKCLLIQPPVTAKKNRSDITPNIPLGLAYIASVIEKKSIEVKILDSIVQGWEIEEDLGNNLIRIGLEDATLRFIISDFKPDLVGVSNLFSIQSPNAHRLYKIVKEIDKDIITVAGGAHPSAAFKDVIKDKNLDFIVMGEGEKSFSMLIDSINNNEDLSKIEGLCYIDNGGYRINPRTNYIEDLDEIPLPAFHLLDMEAYFRNKYSHGGERRHLRFSPIITSRGCPFNCTFCSVHSVWGKGYRVRSPENVLEELKFLVNKYAIKEILFEDDNLTFDLERSEKLFDSIKEARLGLEWNTPNGVSVFNLNENLIKKMKESGCYRLNLAIESGNKYVLNNIIHKPVELDKVERLVYYAKDIGLEVGIFIVVGMPGETKAQIRDTFKYLSNRLKIYFPHIAIATPFPGTRLLEKCLNEGYLDGSYSFDRLATYIYNIETPDWSKKELKKFIEREISILRLKFYIGHFSEFFNKFLFFVKKPSLFLKRILEIIRTIL